MSLPSKRWASILLPCFVLFGFLRAASGRSSGHVLKAFYSSSRVFEEAPLEGITLITTERISESFLINGTTDDVVFQYVFKPPDGVSISEYSTSFECNSESVWDEQSCTVNNAEATILGSTETAQNTSVTCAFSKFPGTTDCQLIATLQGSSRQSASRPLQLRTAYRQIARYESEVITNNVYGVVFLLPDTTTIVSGEFNSFKLDSFDRTEQDVRELATVAFIPGASGTGDNGLQLYSTATLSFDFDDFIFRYMPSCQLTDASFQGDSLVLSDSSACGVGIAVESESTYPALGVKFRAYKSGKVTMRLFWAVFGTSDESFEQIITFEITETAPPVITAIEKLNFYKSVPCAVEILKVVAFNVRRADIRQVFVFSIDGPSSTVWSEARDGFRYDEDLDMSELTFESGGGSGQGVAFELRAVFGSEARTAVNLNNLDLTLMFSTPTLLTGLNQTVLQVEGGEFLEVAGVLEGFGAEDSVYIGTFQIPASDLVNYDTEKLVILSPPLGDLGKSFSYQVTVGVCAERSNPLTLQYQVAPVLSIASSDGSIDETGAYLIKADGETTFVADVTGNNIGIIYLWKILNPAGEEVTDADSRKNSQTFTISSSQLASTTDIYILQATVTNSLGLSVTEEVQVRRPETQDQYVLVNVHEVSEIQRSVDTSTLIQAHVTTETSLDRVITLQWTYRGTTYNVDNTVFDSENGTDTTQVTGPTRFGLEFFILREDLVLGSQEVTLTASLAADPNIKGSDSVAVIVVQSPLVAVINNGINGTLLLTGDELRLSASKSVDPDILPREGDPTEGLTYEWSNCRTSFTSTFVTEISDCSSALPDDATRENITVTSADLLATVTNSGSSIQTIFLSFGLRVTKDSRVAEAVLYFEFRLVQENQKVPQLSSLEVVDTKEWVVSRNELSIFGDIIIQPSSDDELVSWSYDMSLQNQQFLFTQLGTLKNGTGFIASQGVPSRLPLGFNAGVLEPDTKYIVEVIVSASDTNISQAYEISFQTAEVPRLTCTPPGEKNGVVRDTVFTVSGTLSFEAQDIEYCFFLVTESESFSVGQGCSTVPFATFSFYRPGTYSITCEARTSTGHNVDSVTLSDTIILSAPTTTGDEITALSERLATLEEERNRCKALLDDGCLISLILVAKDFAIEVDQATLDKNSVDAQALLDGTKTYIAELAAISDSLAENTVFRPNQVAVAVDISYSLLLVPASFITTEETLFSTLRQAEAAIEATQSLVPITSEDLVSRIRTIANRTIGAAFQISSEGTTRRSLMRTGLTRLALGNVLFTVPRLLAEARAQQADCAFVGEESTSEGGTVTLPDLKLGVRVMCNGLEGGVEVEKVSADVCGTAGRAVFSVAQVPGELISATGLVDMLVDIAAYVSFRNSDGEVIVGDGCIELKIVSEMATNEGNETVVGELVKGDCERCLELVKNDSDVVVVQGDEVKMGLSRTGMFVVGRGFGDITGRGLTSWVTLVGALVGLGVITGVVIWVIVGGIVSDDEEDDGGVFDWEYIERDMYGRKNAEQKQR